MLNRILIAGLAALLLLPTGQSIAEDAPPEVVAARSSAKEHNRRVSQAEEELRQVMERAQKKFVQQVIQAKERLIIDLRRTLRDAAESDRPENLLAISQQIERLDKQIKTLRKIEAPGGQADADAKPGRFEDYYGRWSLTWPNGHNRRFDIDAQGRVTIKSNSSGNGEGSGVGSVYQAKLVDGYLAYHDVNWTKGDRADGRLVFLQPNDDGTVTIGYSDNDLDKADTLKSANEVWRLKLNQTFTPLRKTKATPDDRSKPTDPAEETPRPQPDPVGDPAGQDSSPTGEGSEGGEVEKGETFFGVPLE